MTKKEKPVTIAENIESIKAEIGAACADAGREAGSVRLVAVSKQQSTEKIRAALASGQRIFGENRVQEAKSHWHDLRLQYPDLKLHLIGPLQTNKVKEAVALFDVIETLDREKLARALADEMQKQNRKLPCLIQVNTGNEKQKSGIAADALAAFLQFCRGDCGLDIRGLMCIPPQEENPETHFRLLAELARAHGLPELSMGMSGDFKIAIACGATLVRLGTAVFGGRG